MGSVLLSDPAHHDRREIWNTIADDDMDAADRYIDRLESVFLSLSDSPQMGRDRSKDFRTPGLRSFPVGKYLIFYLADPDHSGVVIARILHAARDVEAILEEKK